MEDLTVIVLFRPFTANADVLRITIVGTKLFSAVTIELNYESRCYDSGSFIDDTFKMPPNSELVIFSERDVEVTDKPTLDLIGTGFMQQICSYLMF
eukprot:jgi/Galph1/2149/GphlegSOOS_G786.1